MKIIQLDKTKENDYLEIKYVDGIYDLEFDPFHICGMYYLDCKKKSDNYGKLHLKYTSTNGLTLIQDDVELKSNILQALELFEPDAYEIYVVEEIINILTKQL